MSPAAAAGHAKVRGVDRVSVPWLRTLSGGSRAVPEGTVECRAWGWVES